MWTEIRFHVVTIFLVEEVRGALEGRSGCVVGWLQGGNAWDPPEEHATLVVEEVGTQKCRDKAGDRVLSWEVTLN